MVPVWTCEPAPGTCVPKSMSLVASTWQVPWMLILTWNESVTDCDRTGVPDSASADASTRWVVLRWPTAPPMKSPRPDGWRRRIVRAGEGTIGKSPSPARPNAHLYEAMTHPSGGSRPSRTATTHSAAMRFVRIRPSCVEAPECGVATTLGSAMSSLVTAAYDASDSLR